MSDELAMRLQPTWPAALAFVALSVICVLEVGKVQPLSFIYSSSSAGRKSLRRRPAITTFTSAP